MLCMNCLPPTSLHSKHAICMGWCNQFETHPSQKIQWKPLNNGANAFTQKKWFYTNKFELR